MRGFSTAMLSGGLVLVAAMTQALAQEAPVKRISSVAAPDQHISSALVASVSSNWAGASEQGFWFDAQAVIRGDSTSLEIFNSASSARNPNDDADFRVEEFELAVGATKLELVVLEGAESSTLQLITDYADETSEGRILVALQFIDNQFTITGYDSTILSDVNLDGVDTKATCVIDFDAGTVAVNGNNRPLPQISFEDRNASLWTFDRVYKQGWCPTGA